MKIGEDAEEPETSAQKRVLRQLHNNPERGFFPSQLNTTEDLLRRLERKDLVISTLAPAKKDFVKNTQKLKRKYTVNARNFEGLELGYEDIKEDLVGGEFEEGDFFVIVDSEGVVIEQLKADTTGGELFYGMLDVCRINGRELKEVHGPFDASEDAREKANSIKEENS